MSDNKIGGWIPCATERRNELQTEIRPLLQIGESYRTYGHGLITLREIGGDLVMADSRPLRRIIKVDMLRIYISPRQRRERGIQGGMNGKVDKHSCAW